MSLRGHMGGSLKDLDDGDHDEVVEDVQDTAYVSPRLSFSWLNSLLNSSTVSSIWFLILELVQRYLINIMIHAMHMPLVISVCRILTNQRYWQCFSQRNGTSEDKEILTKLVIVRLWCSLYRDDSSKSRGYGLFNVFKSLSVSKTLTKESITPALEKMKEHLIGRSFLIHRYTGRQMTKASVCYPSRR